MEKRTENLTVRIKPSFKVELAELTWNLGLSKAVVLENAIKEYMNAIEKKDMKDRTARMEEIGAGGQHATKAYKILIEQMPYAGLKELFDPKCFNDDELIEIIHNKVEGKL